MGRRRRRDRPQACPERCPAPTPRARADRATCASTSTGSPGQGPKSLSFPEGFQTARRRVKEFYAQAKAQGLPAERILREREELFTRLRDSYRTAFPSGPRYKIFADGPLNNAGQLARVSGFVERLPSHAVLSAGGHRVGKSGYFFEPTVISGLLPDDEIVHPEVFGPVIPVQSFDGADQALRWATATPSALAPRPSTARNPPRSWRF